MLSRRGVVFFLAFFLLLSSLLYLKNGLLAQTPEVVSLPSTSSFWSSPESDVDSAPLDLAQHSPKPSPSSAPLPPAKPAPVPVEPIVLTFVFIGTSAAHEGLISIKSALMHSSRPLDVHIICSDDVVAIIEAPLQLVKRPYYNLNVTMHVITRERVQERLIRAGLNPDPGFLTKVLMHELLIGVEKAIFVDTDMIFVVDPVQLWERFDDLDEQVMIAMPTLGPQSHAGEICTCVMLLHLERMRNPSRSPFSSSSTSNTLLVPTADRPSILDPIIRDAMRKGIPSWIGADPPGTLILFDPGAPPFGDQGVVWLLWNARPELFARLGLQWDLTHCREAYGVKLVHEKDGKYAGDKETMMTEEEHIKSQVQTHGEELVFPGILHFNCQPDAGSNVWTWPLNHDSKEQSWAPIITSVVRFKWIWLNRGTALHSGYTRVEKRVGVRWLDEGDDVPTH